MKVAFFTRGLPFTGQTIYQKSLGGSETALYYMAREWSKNGHDVTVFCDCPRPGVYEGVNYRRYQDLQTMAGFLELDVFFCYRFYHQLAKKIKSNLNILVCHDVPSDGGDFAANMWGCDHVFVLSDYHRHLHFDTIPMLREDMVWTTANGIDLSMTDVFLKQPKQDIIVYGSRPERGLDVLLTKIWPKFIQAHPRFRLAISGYDLGNFPIDERMQAYYRQLNDLVVTTPGVQDMGTLAKKDWYELLASAKLMFYPTSFPEIFCINALESQALNTPVITTNSFAMPETVKGGALIEGDPHTDAYVDNFLKAADMFLSTPANYERAQESGRTHAKTYQWKNLAKAWIAKVEELFDKRWESSQPKIVDNLIYHSDLIAATKLAHGSNQIMETQSRIDSALYQNDQRSLGVVDDDFQKVMDFDIDAIGRFNRIYTMGSAVKVFPETPFRLLDMGCHFGEFAAFITNKFPTCRVTAVDISQKCLDYAAKLVKKKSKAANHVEFILAPAQEFYPDQEPYDLVFLGEILEHMEDPKQLLRLAEKWVKPEGVIICTTPNGPWEGNTLNNRHLHNFGIEDIQDLVGKKPDFSLSFIPMGVTPRGDLLGNNVFMYRPDGNGFGEIDYNRKRRVRPYQFVSACLITKNEELDLARCLTSIKPFVDEIIVTDTGSTDETISIAKKFTDKVYEIPGDIDKDGIGNFAAWRNSGLRHISNSADWILWADADEVLVEGQYIHKYLQGEFFQGYVIHQCHQILDIKDVTNDVPVRLFRNNGKWKFWGVIHEQPASVKDINQEVMPAYILPDVQIIHYGYPTEKVRRAKCLRNLPMLKKDLKVNPNRELGIVLAIRDLYNFALWEMDGRLATEWTDKALNYLRNSIQLFYKEFWFSKEKRERYWAKFAFTLYQKSLELLGKAGKGVKEGDPIPVQVALALAGSMGGLQHPKEKYGAETFWFATPDEMKAFLRDKAKQLEKVLEDSGQSPIARFKGSTK